MWPLWGWVLLQLGDTIAGVGLLVVLELCSSKLDDWVAVGCVLLGLAVAIVLPRPPPALVQVLNLLFTLVVTLSVCLNLFRGLCPPEGKELVLIPVYFLLCLSRSSLTWVAGLALAVSSLIFVFAFLGVVSADPALKASQLSSSLTSSDDPLMAGCSLFVTAVYGGLSHLLPAYVAKADVQPSFQFVLGGGACRLAVIFAVGLSKSALLSLFLSPPRPHSLHPLQPNYLAAFYGACLLFACMHMASVWFEQLKSVSSLLSGRVYTARRLVRLQHILNAGLVGAAWGFPLHLSELRVLLVVGCLLLQIFFGARARG